MFGFFGKYQERLTQWVATGKFSTANNVRLFSIVMNKFDQLPSIAFNFEYDPTNTGANPDDRLTGLAAIAFDSKSIMFSSSGSNSIEQPTSDERKYFFVNVAAFNSAFRYNSLASLSPTTRKVNTKFNTPQSLRALSTLVNIGFGGDYTVDGAFRIPYLINLQHMMFRNGLGINDTSRITSFTGMWPPKLKSFMCTSFNSTQINFTIQHKFPESMDAIQVNVLGLSNFATLIQDVINLKALILGQYLNTTVTDQFPFQAPASLDISHIPNLEVLIIGSATMTSFTYDFSSNTLLKFHGDTLSGLSDANWRTLYDTIVVLPNIKYIGLHAANKTYTKDIANTDLTQSSLVEFYIHGNRFTGSVNLTTARTNILIFKIGQRLNQVLDANKNTFSQVDVTGLTHATTLDLSNSKIDDLELPVNTACVVLGLGGNKLDTTVLTNLISQVNAMTALTTLIFCSGVSANNFQVASAVDHGQDSTNGLGTIDFSTLNLQNLHLGNCKVTGTLEVKRSTIIQLYLNQNTITAIGGSGNFSAMTHFNMSRNAGLDFDFTKCIVTTFIIGNNDSGAPNTALTTVDLSARTSTNQWLSIQFQYCSALTSITLPTVANRITLNASTGNAHLQFSNCVALATITNLENVNFSTLTSPTVPRIFNVASCALNQDLKIGINNFLPTLCSLQNNGMNATNVDLNIDNIYQNRSKWSTTIVAKSMNIAGTNAAATGTYQAPTGFVLGVSDGTPASAKEQLYVLVNNYGWTMTYN